MTTTNWKLGLRLLVIGITAFAVVHLFPSELLADYSLDINQVNEVTHIEIPEIIATDYQLTQKGDKVELLVSGLNPKSAEKLQRYSDQHIKKIGITKSSSLNKDIVTITLNGKKTQVFDYLTDSPSALSIDFYVDDKAATVAEEEVKPAPKAPVAAAVRAPASDEFLQSTPFIEIVKEGKDGSSKTKGIRTKKEFLEEIKGILDFDLARVLFKFDSIIETRGKIFIKFPVLINQNTQLAEIVKKKVFYQVEEADDEETKLMLRTKELFSKNDLKSFLRAKEVYIRKFPNTKFMEMLMFMEGDALYDLSKAEKSKTLLEQSLNVYDAVVNRYPESPLAERTTLFTASLRMDLGEYMGAIRNLRTYVKKYEKSPLRDNMEIYLAHCLLRVHENNDALKIFERLMSSNDPEVKRQATYEVGDVYFEKKDYKKAIDFYTAAFTAFPEGKKEFPNAYFNKAEAEFIDERYKESLETFKAFLVNFGQHPYANYAWTRMGEILEIADEPGKKWAGYYNEGVFRFQKTNGGAISKIHLLSHQMMEAEERRLSILLDEMRSLEKEIKLPQADEFVAFNIADAHFDRGNHKAATDELISFFKKVKIPSYADKFHRRIGRGISYQIRDMLAAGKVEEAFKLFEIYDSLWFKKSERIDFSFLKGLAFEKSHVYKKALKEYAVFADKFKSLASPEEVIVVEQLPAIDDIYMRMANCHFQLKDLASAREFIAKVNVTKITPDRQDQAYLLQAQIADAGGQKDAVNTYLAQIKADTLESVAFKVRMLEKDKKYTEAIAVTDGYLEKNKPKPAEKFALLRSKLGLLEKIGMNDKYYNFSSRLFDEYKKTKFDFDSEKYKLGLHLSEQGKTKEADEVWATIQDGSMWKKLATESSTEKKWNGTYKKYIERIPAMAESKEEKK
jgi:tetratricopeptide (TPR) repeat protein